MTIGGHCWIYPHSTPSISLSVHSDLQLLSLYINLSSLPKGISLFASSLLKSSCVFSLYLCFLKLSVCLFIFFISVFLIVYLGISIVYIFLSVCLFSHLHIMYSTLYQPSNTSNHYSLSVCLSLLSFLTVSTLFSDCIYFPLHSINIL